ncbi:RCC1 domain-containing protein [Bacilliculturomica massiliensis]|uniref:hypothetical protein n=1 Tax=Bacilliculturomica massiliensis TaxID=1917867 RepID=UPI00103098C2|nr:hypothetical protein [Bacilliculturomica massiliensis]
MPKKRRTGGRAGRRILTCLLAAAMLVSGIPLAQGTTPEAYAAGNATAATWDQIESTRMTNTGWSGMAKIVDGKLFVWGNANQLGISSYETPEGNTSSSFPVPYPVQVPADKFDGDVVQVSANWGALNLALTEYGTIYRLTNTVTKLYESPAGKKIVYLSNVGGRAFFAKDENGDWYSYLNASGNTGYYCLTDEAGAELKPIKIDDYRAALGNGADGNPRQIKEIVNMAAYATMIICTDGTLFMAGSNSYHGLGNGASRGYSTAYGTLYNVSEALGGVKFTAAAHAEDVAFVAVDVDGNVWGWGCDHEQRFMKRNDAQETCGHEYAHSAVSVPEKFFDASLYGKKAVRAYLTSWNALILCDDNTIYATGTNTNNMISTSESAQSKIYKPTQIFAEVSQKDTIVGLTPTTNSVTIYTLKGDSYFTGSNSSGTAGNGTTVSPKPGETTETVPDMPPSKPFTKNGMYVELEVNRIYGNQSKKVTYTANPTAEHPNQVRKTVEGQSPVDLPDGMIGDDAVPAGQIFKLNVYFEDFGKLHTFLVPIRFNPTYVKAVDLNGERYPESTVTAGLGSTSGIQQLFTSENWLNGALGSGVEGTYPKVNNKDGWVSVLGYSPAYKAQIEGAQKMFSVAFMAVGSTPANTLAAFDIATRSNAPSKGDPGFDVASKQEFDYGAYWSINNPYSVAEVISYAFDTGAFPKIATTVKNLNAISLDIVRADGSPVDVASDIEGAGQGSRAINNKNTDEIYTVKVKANPEDASFPQADWTVTLMGPNDDNSITLTDYITIVEQKDTYLKFKLPDNFSQTKVGWIRFHAAARINTTLTSDLDVYVKSFDPPEFIHIKEKKYSENTAAGVPAIEEKIYQNKLGNDSEEEPKENRTFTVEFPVVQGDAAQNKLVTWSLLDKGGNPLDTTLATCPVRIVTSTPATDDTNASVTIQPLKTTYGDDYVILKVASLYDPSVSDSIRIKVQFKASEMKFKQEIVRLPFNMEKDLEDLLEIAPQDVYSTDLVWTYTPTTTAGYINFNGTGVISSNQVATPVSPTPVYETITVTDQISGVSASVKVSVINLDSPLNINNIVVKNLLGSKDDTVEIKDGLAVGDTIYFYSSYDDTEPYMKVGPLTEAQTPYFKFATAGLLDSAGGEIAVSVVRKWGDSSGPVETSKIPVAYSAEPSKVYGYVSLAGKTELGANKGIRVDIDGIGGSQTVYTDENGRFEFTEYIKPGNYTLTLSQTRYLTRSVAPNKKTGYQGLTIPAAEEFLIASQNAPLKLYPGDVNMDNIIDYRDLDIYVKNWVGQINPELPGFDLFNFADGEEYSAIGTDDLNLLLIHYGWPTGKYADWITPAQ